MKGILPCIFLLLSACRRVPEVRPGSTVKLSYAMTVDGAVVDSSTVRFVSGSGDMLAGLDEQLLGLKAGSEKAVILTPEKGFGAIDPAKVKTLPIEKFGAQAKLLKPGATVSGMAGGKSAEARVVKVDARGVVLDFNHPRAGKTLSFTVKILEVSGP